MTSEPPSKAPAELRSFGRRHGRKLSRRQSALMQDRLPVLALELTAPCPRDPELVLFAAPKSALWLEIGFGGAEHLLWQAAHARNVGIIGCEPFEEGVAKALTGIVEQALDNVRLHTDDARQLLRWLPDACLDRVFILFPDPWPKRKHRKRRLVGGSLLRELARVMKPNAELRLATDIGDYARTMLVALAQQRDFEWTAAAPDDWRLRTDDWPETRYEAKARAARRRCAFLRFRRR